MYTELWEWFVADSPQVAALPLWSPWRPGGLFFFAENTMIFMG